MDHTLDLCRFGFLAHLEILQVVEYPPKNAGASVLDIFGEITPDAPIVTLMASSLGLKVGLISNNIGNDLSGSQLSRMMSRFDVCSTVQQIPNIRTPRSTVICDNESNRTWFSFLSNVKQDLNSVDLTLFMRSKLVYVDLYSIIHEQSLRALRTIAQHKIPLFVNLGGDKLTSDAISILKQTNLIFVQTSLDDQQAEPSLYAKEIHKILQPKYTVITLSKKGSICVSQSEEIYTPAYNLHTIHSNGAGASFSAGLLYAYLNQWPLKMSLKFASALGGLFCTEKNGFGKFSSEYILNFIHARVDELEANPLHPKSSIGDPWRNSKR